MAGFSLEFALNMIRNGTWTLEEAWQYAGGRWSEAFLRQQLQAGAYLGAAGEAGAGAAAPVVAGGATGLSAGTIATIAGGLLVAAVATAGIAYLAGSLSGDKETAWGAEKKGDIRAMLSMPSEERETLRKVEDPVSVRPAEPREGYAIWLVGDRKEVIVGRKSEVEEQPSRGLIGWGLAATKVKDTRVAWEKVGEFHDTPEKARAAYDKALQPGTRRILPLAAGTVARFNFDDQPHHIDNATRFLP
ncbi:MAG: hypothetical protein U0793_19045 [Gemmataceae bacterium]